MKTPSNCHRITIVSPLLIWLAANTAQALTIISPGTTVVLSAGDDLSCATVIDAPSGTGTDTDPDAICETNEENAGVDPRHLNVLSRTGLVPAAQRTSATARLINDIAITAAPASGGSELLPVQIATEVSWSGVLVVGGLNSTFSQVVATLQVRDTTTDQVVASNTFLFERIDSDITFDPDEVLDGVDVTSSSGADITALLVRGRSYSIEVEAKCDVSMPLLLGVAVCSFFDAQGSIDVPGLDALFEGDGFDVANITVSVGSDLVEQLTRN